MQLLRQNLKDNHEENQALMMRYFLKDYSKLDLNVNI